MFYFFDEGVWVSRPGEGRPGRRSATLNHAYFSIDGAVAAAQSGDPAARAALLDRFRPLLLSLTRPHAEIDREEMLQEAACQFLQLVDEYNANDGVLFGSYLKTKLRWRLSNYRRLLRRLSGPLVPFPEDGTTPAAKIGPGPEEGNRLEIREALDRLPAKQRDLLIRWYWHDQEAGRIADDLGVTPRAVRALRRRAETHLGNILNEPSPAAARSTT